MTDGRGTKSGLNKYMKQNDFEKIPTTRDSRKSYYYHINTLVSYSSNSLFKDYSNVRNKR